MNLKYPLKTIMVEKKNQYDKNEIVEELKSNLLNFNQPNVLKGIF